MRKLFAPTLLVVLVVAGCGSSSNPSSSTDSAALSSSSSDSTSSSSTPAASGGASATTINMKDVSFAPEQDTVKVGQTVTWKNQDGFNHNVTADSGASFKSPDFSQGGSYKYTPKKAGTIEYECTLHPGMKATLTVK